MRLKGRLWKLEQIAAPLPPKCDCPITFYSRLADGSIYPPSVPCLRGRCPDDNHFREGPRPIKHIIIGMAVRPEGGPPPGCEVRLRDFQAWDPATDKPRLRVILWRDQQGRLRYYGPPRWYEIEGLKEPRLVRAVGVTETMEEIVAELRRTDETPSLAQLNASVLRPTSEQRRDTDGERQVQDVARRR
jgi:hypothetical protein